MKQRYIDFVPAKGKKMVNKPGFGVVKKSSFSSKRPSAKVTATSVKKPIKTEEVAIEEMFVERSDSAAKMGVIEDFQPKFVRGVEVKKRPLARKTNTKMMNVRGAASARSAAVARGVARGATSATMTTAGVAAAKNAIKAAGGAKASSKVGPRGPRATFVNVNKIEKRPLSRAGYNRKPVAFKKEAPKAPERIIAKPEKDSNAGLIITIVITIILGAAAGTVAFLLLPK